MDVSPQGTFLLTWERAAAATTTAQQQQEEEKGDNDNNHNLKVWNIHTGDLVIGFRQKSLSRDAWPYLQWTHDERLAFLHCTNEVRVYPGTFPQQADTRFVEKLRIPGITSLSVATCSCQGAAAAAAAANTTTSPAVAAAVAPNARILFTAFIAKDKNKPSRAALYEYPSSSSQQQQPSHPITGYPALVSKSLFQAEEMTVHWSPKGDAALIALQSTVDTSGQSYYGSTSLYLMSPQHHRNDAITVPLPQEGPVLDVAWMPNPDKPSTFVVIAGRMPAMASMHNGTDGKATFLFGNRHQNTIHWAPHGRFLFLAGFGNLAGDMTFWDKNKEKQIPSAAATTTASGHHPVVTAACTVGHSWSPDSRLICVSTTSPRMNVDNGCSIYRYNGDKLSRVPWDNQNYQPDRLLQACFLPAATPDVYPDRPQSPTLKDLGKGPDASAAATAATTAAAAPKPAGRYVPPSARNRAGGGGGTSLAERMRAEREGTMKGAQKVVENNKKMPAKVIGASGKVVVGMAPPPTTTEQGKTKSAQRREKQKQKKQEEEARKELEEKIAAATAAASAAVSQDDPEKRARKLKKALKQIDELKQRDPTSLNDDQKKKIASEKELLAELQQLGL